MATPQHKNPCRGGHEIYNLGKSTLPWSLLLFTLSLYEPCHGVKKIFKEIHINFTHFTPKLPPLGVGEGHEIYNFLSPYPTDATLQIWSRLAQ